MNTSVNGLSWTERPEMYLGQPTIVLIAEKGGVRVHSRYPPKSPISQTVRSWIVEAIECLLHGPDAVEFLSSRGNDLVMQTIEVRSNRVYESRALYVYESPIVVPYPRVEFG